MASFSVLTEPWIPAMDKAGEVREYGILELLEKARELDGIVDPAPPIQFGLYRMVVAFLMDALGLRETDDLADILERGQVDMDAVRAYVTRCGPERFDLFNSGTPFLQPCGDGAKLKPVANLLPHLPSGTFAIHFHHWQEGEHAFSPAVCARALTAIAPFMTAGGAGYSPSINGNPPWYVLVRGESLFETLLLNCYAGETGLRGSAGPSWLAETPVVPKQDAYCNGLLEGLTWRPRMARLMPGDGGVCTYSGAYAPVLVREMRWGPGLAFVGQDAWTDPNVAYLHSAKGRSPLRPQENRELWRDTGPLMLLRREEHGAGENKLAFDRPRVVDQLRDLRERYGLFTDRRFDCVEVYGMRTDGKMKVFEWQCERLELPSGVLRNRRAPGLVRAAIEMAEGGAYALEAGLKRAYPRDGEGNEKAFGRLIQEAHRQYWSALHGPFRKDLLSALAVTNADNEVQQFDLLAGWGRTLRKVATEQFEAVLDPLDTDAKALQRQAEARTEFRKRLGWAATPPGVRAERWKRKGER